MAIQLLKSSAFRWLFILAGVISLSSFHYPMGGDRFEIYLNKKLVFQQFVHDASASEKTFQIDRNSYNAEIDVVYSHCGVAGKNRVVTFTDGENHVLKQWKFGDGESDKATMTCSLKEILLAQKNNSLAKMKIYYSSEQLPKQKLLATVILADHQSTP